MRDERAPGMQKSARSCSQTSCFTAIFCQLGSKRQLSLLKQALERVRRQGFHSEPLGATISVSSHKARAHNSVITSICQGAVSRSHLLPFQPWLPQVPGMCDVFHSFRCPQPRITAHLDQTALPGILKLFSNAVLMQIQSCCRAAERFGYSRFVQGILYFLFFLFPQIKETK